MPSSYEIRLQKLRALISEQGGQGFLIPRTDAFQGEYVAPCDERLAWLTGFTGSAGLAVILQDKAALFVDGRYTLQAHQQVDTSLYEIHHLVDEPADRWICENLKPQQKLLYDPWLHTVSQIGRWQKSFKNSDVGLESVVSNPLDQLWIDRPELPSSLLKIHDIKFSGKSSQEKRQQIADFLKKIEADGVLLSKSESIAWLYNIRGGDIPHTPVAHAFALFWADKSTDFFIDPRKVTGQITTHLGKEVRIHDISTLESFLEKLSKKTIVLDPSITSIHLNSFLAGCLVIYENDPCELPKSLKNDVELEGARQAHVRDGVAVTKFLAWLAKEVEEGHKLTEISASDQLANFRREQELFQDLSFETISGFGSNGAVVHYRATSESNKSLKPNNIYLLDSGGQYLDGTTDITRTIAIGQPTEEQRENFTRVLKGHIALAMAVFPKGTTGSQLDVLARLPLWQAGLDYDHGTGHGVGSYLGVHEGPQRISKTPSTTALQPGMILSNEPGYYKTNAYGIRIENLVAVVEAHELQFSERSILCFETLTLVPIDLTLVVSELLTSSEKEWLNTYHLRVRESLLPHVDPDTAAWLITSTEPV